MTLMRFDPFRALERLTEQALGGGRGPRPRKVEIGSSAETAEKKPQIVESASREEHANA